MSLICLIISLKPIFHCNTKHLALGVRVEQYPQRESFVLGIPTCCYLKTLKFALPPTRMLKKNLINLFTNIRQMCRISFFLANAKICVTPNANPQGKRWNIGRVGSPRQNSRGGHVDFMLFVSLSLALGSQREHNFQWNMGLGVLSHVDFKKWLCRQVTFSRSRAILF